MAQIRYMGILSIILFFTKMKTIVYRMEQSWVRIKKAPDGALEDDSFIQPRC
jgi:hypothetical protein